MKKDGKICKVPPTALEELKRLIGDCKRLGIYLKSQKQAFDLMAIKSYRGQMTRQEIIDYLYSIEEKIK